MRRWRALEPSNIAEVPVNTGVYAVRDGSTNTLGVHVVGARTRYGLRGELLAAFESSVTTMLEFTYVSTNNYFTLYREIRDFPERFDPDNPFVRRDGYTPAQRGSA